MHTYVNSQTFSIHHEPVYQNYMQFHTYMHEQNTRAKCHTKHMYASTHTEIHVYAYVYVCILVPSRFRTKKNHMNAHRRVFTSTCTDINAHTQIHANTLALSCSRHFAKQMHTHTNNHTDLCTQTQRSEHKETFINPRSLSLSRSRSRTIYFSNI
jgi:hypothetical protein